MEFEVTREIQIDMGHRLVNHESKCANVHGHRYRIEATVRGALGAQGPSEGMVMDFGFLKDLMVEHIDGPCDHGCMLQDADPLFELVADLEELEVMLGKLIVVDFPPTAENLAAYWYHKLMPHMPTNATLARVCVWETPNCRAVYPC